MYVNGEIIDGELAIDGQVMAVGANDNGSWTITLGPEQPQIYYLQGVDMPEPGDKVRIIIERQDKGY